MIKKALPYIAGMLVLAAVILLLLLHKQQRRFDGRITLNTTHTLPYGAYAAYHLLNSQFPKAKVSLNKDAPGEWKLATDSGNVLLILNDFFNPAREELDSLVKFTQRGNFVFISTWTMSESAQHFFGVTQSDVYNRIDIFEKNRGINIKDTFTVCLNDSLFTMPTRFSYPGVDYDNRFKTFDNRYTYPLGYDKFDYANLLAIRTASGAFFLHSAPITFTNLFLLYGNNHIYFEKLMSLLPANAKSVLWDEYFMYHKPTNNDNNNSILHVLLKYKNFRWAFWLALTALALYVVTEVKRRQRLIPEYITPVNETLTFVSTIGKLYHERGDHKNLAEKLNVYFLDFVRSQYKIQTAELDENFIHTLAAKSSTSIEEITDIIISLHTIRNNDKVTDQQLTDYHSRLQNFYNKV